MRVSWPPRWFNSMSLGLGNWNVQKRGLGGPPAVVPHGNARIRRHRAPHKKRRGARRRFASVASLMTPLMRVEWLEDRTLLSAVSWTGGGNDNLWNDGKNWSTGSVPQFADDVTISAAARTTIQVATTSVAIHSLSTNAAISVADHLRPHLVAELANECRSVLLGHVATHRDRS
jgi:hypothetical protein